uniref:Cadherin domain-containing protein n=1 Tax=Macrostomum lignano TaxID=282301 RepID=A0A1I8IRP7_9PLAT
TPELGQVHAEQHPPGLGHRGAHAAGQLSQGFNVSQHAVTADAAPRIPASVWELKLLTRWKPKVKSSRSCSSRRRRLSRVRSNRSREIRMREQGSEAGDTSTLAVRTTFFTKATSPITEPAELENGIRKASPISFCPAKPRTESPSRRPPLTPLPSTAVAVADTRTSHWPDSTMYMKSPVLPCRISSRPGSQRSLHQAITMLRSSSFLSLGGAVRALRTRSSSSSSPDIGAGQQNALLCNQQPGTSRPWKRFRGKKGLRVGLGVFEIPRKRDAASSSRTGECGGRPPRARCQLSRRVPQGFHGHSADPRAHAESTAALTCSYNVFAVVFKAHFTRTWAMPGRAQDGSGHMVFITPAVLSTQPIESGGGWLQKPCKSLRGLSSDKFISSAESAPAAARLPNCRFVKLHLADGQAVSEAKEEEAEREDEEWKGEKVHLLDSTLRHWRGQTATCGPVAVCRLPAPGASRNLLLLLLLLLLTAVIDEELPPGSPVVSLLDAMRRDGHLLAPDAIPDFRQFNADPPGCERYFRVEPATGHVTVQHRVDRDRVCAEVSACCSSAGADDSPCRLTLQVQSDREFSHIVTLAVQIVDLNDNAPRWSSVELTREFSEAAQPGEFRSLPLAEDADSPRLSVQRYALLPRRRPSAAATGADPASAPSLRLTLKLPLDREAKDSYEFGLAAFDGGSPPRNGTVRLRILVADENDEVPTFDKPTYEADIREDAPMGRESPTSKSRARNFSFPLRRFRSICSPSCPVLQVRAVDKDVGQNGRVTYSISAFEAARVRSLFVMDPASGSLRVAAPLDFEQSREHRFTVVAQDQNRVAPRQSTAQVIVTVIDVNDEPPRIGLSSRPAGGGPFQIVENEKPRTVTIVTVRDADSGDNGKVSAATSATSVPHQCHISATSVPKNSFSWLTARRIVCHTQPSVTPNRLSHPTVCHTQPSVTPNRLSHPTVCHTVCHTQPSVTPNRLSHPTVCHTQPSVTPNRLSHPTVCHTQPSVTPNVCHTQPSVTPNRLNDVATSLQVSCSLSGSHKDLFKLVQLPLRESGATLYRLMTARPLDRETDGPAGRSLSLRLSCSDSGQPANTAVETVNLEIVDLNDNPPAFPTSVFYFTINEATRQGQVAFSVAAEDPDAGDNARLAYAINATGPGAEAAADVFKIGADGRATLTRRLDRETVPRYAFDVVAFDHGEPSLSATASVVVMVEDDNDNAPAVAPFFAFLVAENASIGHHVGQLNATDPDEGENARVVFRMSPSASAPSSPFHVSTQGLIVLISPLDREHTSRYEFAVLAQDSSPTVPRTSTATVVIDVEDVNDCAPRFLFPSPGNRTLRISAKTSVATMVVRLVAKDADSGANGRVAYFIRRPLAGPFHVDVETGELTLVRPVAAEDLAAGGLNLTVVARDSGYPALETEQTLAVLFSASTADRIGGAGGPGGGGSGGRVSESSSDSLLVVAGLVAVTAAFVLVLLLGIILLTCRQRCA